ncbi:MAG: addiction module antidote protein, HigA family [Burkholderiales bacterium RIFCSPHIGHO2_12_FULL_61_11]|nr:MAG: addiction module antidote protein, HigA family [Burkholderiales bacterium RIFCSPHIGHO2_12_FULL_61_11]
MNQLPNIHPGEVLREEFLIPLQISQYRLAKEIGVTEARISTICTGKRAITADTALRLAAFFGTTPGFWLGLQADYDTEEAETSLHDALSGIHRFDSVAAGSKGSGLAL